MITGVLVGAQVVMASHWCERPCLPFCAPMLFHDSLCASNDKVEIISPIRAISQHHIEQLIRTTGEIIDADIICRVVVHNDAVGIPTR